MQSEARASDRELGLAYASIALRNNNREWGLRALELLRSEDQAHPNDPKIISSLAQLYDRTNRDDEACALYEAAVRLDPSVAASKVNLAGCLAKRGQTDQALRLWTEVLKTNPSMETARLNLAVALFRTGRKTEARAGLLEALRFNPASRRARELLAGLE
jgi:tetratricopeptide (TPR) repeat protein